MRRVLVTGGTGTLGRSLVPQLLELGYEVVVMSRREPRGVHPRAGIAVADLIPSDGLEAALEGAQIVIHAATSPGRDRQAVDVDGTGRLLRAARASGVQHVVYPSIVGIDRIPYPYYRHKLAAEARVVEGDVPFSIVRGTQFHGLVDWLLRRLHHRAVVLVPAGFRFQSVDVGEFAAALVRQVVDGPTDERRAFGGPEILELEQMARVWRAVRELRTILLRVPVPGGLGHALRAGWNTDDGAERGTRTWAAWLEARYRPEPGAAARSGA